MWLDRGFVVLYCWESCGDGACCVCGCVEGGEVWTMSIGEEGELGSSYFSWCYACFCVCVRAEKKAREAGTRLESEEGRK